jgi:hypothetical protein
MDEYVENYGTDIDDDDIEDELEEDMEVQEGGASAAAVVQYAPSVQTTSTSDCPYNNITEAIAPFSKIPRQRVMKLILNWGEYRKIGFFEKLGQGIISGREYGLKSGEEMFKKFLDFLECIYSEKISGNDIELTVKQLQNYKSKKDKQRILISMAYVYCIAIGKDSKMIEGFMDKIVETYDAVEKTTKDIKSKKTEVMTTEISKDIKRDKLNRAKLLDDLYRNIPKLLIKEPAENEKKSQFQKELASLDTHDDITVFIYNALLDRASIEEKQQAIAKEAAARRQQEIEVARERTKKAEEVYASTKLVQKYDKEQSLQNTFINEIENIKKKYDENLNTLITKLKDLINEETISDNEIKAYLLNEPIAKDDIKKTIEDKIKSMDTGRLENIALFNNLILRLNKYLNSIQMQPPNIKDLLSGSISTATDLRKKCQNVVINLQKPEMLPIPKDLNKPSQVQTINKEQSALFTNEMIQQIGINIGILKPEVFAAIPPELFDNFTAPMIIAMKQEQIENMTKEQANVLCDFLVSYNISKPSNEQESRAKAILNKIIEAKEVQKVQTAGAAPAATTAPTPATTSLYTNIKKTGNPLLDAFTEIVLPKVKDNINAQIFKYLESTSKKMTSTPEMPSLKYTPLEKVIQLSFADSKLAEKLQIFDTVKTEDLSDFLKNQEASKISVALVKRINKASDAVIDIKADSIKDIAPKVFATFEVTVISKLIPNQIKNITSSQLGLLSREQLEALSNNFKELTKESFTGITPDVLKTIDLSKITINDEHIKQINDTQFQNLTLDQLKYLCTKVSTADNTKKLLNLVTPGTFALISSDKLKNLLESGCVVQDQIKGLKDMQKFRSLKLIDLIINSLSVDQTGFITEQQIKELCDIAIPADIVNDAIGNILHGYNDNHGAFLNKPVGHSEIVADNHLDDLTKLVSEIKRMPGIPSTNEKNAYSIYLIANFIKNLTHFDHLTSDAIRGIHPLVFSQLGIKFGEINNTNITDASITTEQISCFAKYSIVTNPAPVNKNSLQFTDPFNKNITSLFHIARNKPECAESIAYFIRRINENNSSQEKIKILINILKDYNSISDNYGTLIQTIPNYSDFAIKLLGNIALHLENNDNNCFRNIIQNSTQELGEHLGHFICSVSQKFSVANVINLLNNQNVNNDVFENIIANFIVNAGKYISPNVFAITQLTGNKLIFFSELYKKFTKTNNSEGVKNTLKHKILITLTNRLYTGAAANAVVNGLNPVNEELVASVKNIAFSSKDLGTCIGNLMYNGLNMNNTPLEMENRLKLYVKFINGICSDFLVIAANKARCEFIEGVFAELNSDLTKVSQQNIQFSEIILVNLVSGIVGDNGHNDANTTNFANSSSDLGKSIGQLMVNACQPIAGEQPNNLDTRIENIIAYLEKICKVIKSGPNLIADGEINNNFNKYNFLNSVFDELTNPDRQNIEILALKLVRMFNNNLYKENNGNPGDFFNFVFAGDGNAARTDVRSIKNIALLINNAKNETLGTQIKYLLIMAYHAPGTGANKKPTQDEVKDRIRQFVRFINGICADNLEVKAANFDNVNKIRGEFIKEIITEIPVIFELSTEAPVNLALNASFIDKIKNKLRKFFSGNTPTFNTSLQSSYFIEKLSMNGNLYQAPAPAAPFAGDSLANGGCGAGNSGGGGGGGALNFANIINLVNSGIVEINNSIANLVEKAVTVPDANKQDTSRHIANLIHKACFVGLSGAGEANKLAFVKKVIEKLAEPVNATATQPEKDAASVFANHIITSLVDNNFMAAAELPNFVDSNNDLGKEVGKLICKSGIQTGAVVAGDVGTHAKNSAILIGACCTVYMNAGEPTNFIKGLFEQLVGYSDAATKAQFSQHIITSLASIGAAGFNILQGSFRRFSINADTDIGKQVGKLIVNAGEANIWNSVHFIRVAGANKTANNGANFFKGVFGAITDVANYKPATAEADRATFVNAILETAAAAAPGNRATAAAAAAGVPNAAYLKVQSNAAGAVPDQAATTLCHNDFLKHTNFAAEVLAKLIYCAGADEAQRAWIKYAAVAAVARSHDGSTGAGNGRVAGVRIPPQHISEQAALITARTARAAAAPAAAPNAAGALGAGAAGAVEAVYIATYAMSSQINNIGAAHNPVNAATQAELEALLVRRVGANGAGVQASAVLNTAPASADIAAARRALLLSMPLPSQAETTAAVAANAPAAVTNVDIPNTIGKADTAADSAAIANAAKDAKTYVDANAPIRANFRLFSTGSALLINIARANNMIGNAAYNTAAVNTSAYGSFAVMALPRNIPGQAGARVIAGPGQPAAADDVIFLVNALAYYINGAAAPRAITPSGLKALYEKLFSAPGAPVAASVTQSPATLGGGNEFQFPKWANITNFTTAAGGVAAVQADLIINKIVDSPGDRANLAADPNNQFYLLGGSTKSIAPSKPLRVKKLVPRTRKHNHRLSGKQHRHTIKKANRKTQKRQYVRKSTLRNY